MSESVKILIDAEDKASKVVQDTTANVEQNVKQIKEVGGRAKASTEFIGVLAQTMGGSELAGFAQQLAGVTEKVGQFSEVSKAGGSGALAFKLGLAGLVGVAAFEVGKFLGNAIFETDKWNKELEKAIALNEELNSSILKLADVRIGDAKASIQLLKDPEEQVAALKKLRDAASVEVNGYLETIKRLEEEKAKIAFDDEGNIFAPITGLSTRATEIERDLAEAEKIKKAANERFLALDKELGDKARQNEVDRVKRNDTAMESGDKALEGLRKQLELQEALANGDQARITAQQQFADILKQAGGNLTDDAKAKLAKDQQDAIELLKQIEESKTKAETGKKVASEIDRLQEETIALEQGREAAIAFKLELNGLGEAEAKSLASQQYKLELQKQEVELNKQRATAAQELEKSELNRLAVERAELEKGKEAAHAMKLEQQGLSKEIAAKIAKEQSAVDARKKEDDDAKKFAEKSKEPLQAIESRFLSRAPGNDGMMDLARQQLETQKQLLDATKKAKEPKEPRPPVVKDSRRGVVVG